uniref:PKD-like domain-containing protein n=1 Tax=Olivibacter sitiensis TaxID=376470 RepID=UPI00056C5E66
MKKDLSRSMMFLNLYKRHLIGLVALMLLCSLNLFGQTYRTHYIAPASWSYFSNANELVVATNSTTPINVTVNRSDGTFVTTLSVSSGAPVTYRFTGSTGSAPRNANNTVLSGVGLIVSADEPISVSIRNVASDSSGPDANIKGNANLFSFGDPAIGTSFRIGYYRDGILDTRDGRNHYPVYSVMALEDNTTVSRNGTVLTTLNAGQSYLFEGQYIGALIESSGPVVMNMGAHYDRPYGGCFDGASNQMVPTASLANDYFVIRGNGGSGTDGAVAEQTTVVATAANTVVNLIHYNASGAQVGASSFTLNNPGDFQSFEHGVNGQQFSSTRITTTQSIAAYSGVASGCEIEAYTLAPLSECGGSQHVQNVRFTNFNSGTLPYFGYVFLPLSSPAAVVELNGVDIMTHTGVNRVTLGASGYELITFTNEAIGSPTNIVLISDVRMTIGMIQSGAGFSMASFLTPFPEQALQPQINTSGGCALNTLTADAGHSNYQWYLNGSPIRGANSHTYEALISGSYSVSYTLDCGPGIQSLPVAVNLCADLGVVKEVSNMAPAVGSEVTFTITATNHGPSNATGVSVTDILPSGYTYVSHNAVPSTSAYNFNTGLWSIGAMGLDATATLTITATVRPTGEYANTATIQGAQNDENVDNNVSSVTPVPLPYIALTSANETDNQLLCLGETLETITYQVGGSATGVNLSGSLPAGVTGAFDPATRIYTITGTPTVLGTFSYTLTTTGGTGAAAELTGTITVNPIPSVDNQTVTVCSGDTFFITPTGVPAGTTYTWGDPVITGSVTGASAQATGQTSIGQTLTNTGNGVATVVYTVTPTSGTCVGEPFTVTVTVSPENTITPPAVTEFCGGTTEGTDLTIVGTDLGPGVTYKWQINTNPNDLNNPWGYDDIDIPGADGKDYNPGTLTATGTGFRRMVVAGAPSCVDESSNIVRFIVMPVINNVIVPSTILENCGTINEYDIGGTLTGGNNNNFTFQWQRSTDGISWTDIPGADGQQYNPNTVTAPTYFRRIAYSGNGYIYNFSCESISNVLFYNTNATPATPGSITGEAVVCSPASSQSYSIAAVSGATSYTWSYSGTGVTINGTGTSVTLTFAANATSGTLSVVANGACGESNPSELAITVTAAPVITTQPAGNTYCEGETITALQVVASGGTGYQWYSNTTASNTGGVLIGGATSATYTPTVNAPETYYYYVVVSGDGACSTTSGVATITINEETTITGQPQASAVYCVDESATALGVMASGTGTLGYQWYSNTTNSNTGGTAIAGATSSTYTPSTATSGTYYYYVVVSSDCGTASSTVSTVTVNEETT